MDYKKVIAGFARQRKEIRALHAKRWTAKEIAAKYGITTQRVYAICGPFKENVKPPR